MEGEAYRVAAKWWADWLRGRHAKSIVSIGADPATEALVLLAKVPVVAAGGELADQLIRDFELLLCDILSDGLPPHDHIYTNYNPCPTLITAALLVGLPLNKLELFPSSTTMWICAERVDVSCGYGQPVETVWEMDR